MNAMTQTSPNVTITLTLDEVNTILQIVAQTPLPYNTSHHLIGRLTQQVEGSLRAMQDQSATQQATSQADSDDSEAPDEPPEHKG